MSPELASQLLVFGEALIDLKASSALSFQGFVGGSPLNVALAGARLELPSALATRVSTDFFGMEIVNLLEANHVRLDYLERGEEPTTLAFVQVQDGHPSYSFRFLDTSTLAYSGSLEVPASLRAMHYGGSLNPLFEPVSSRVLAVVEGFSGFKHFDPNVRPAVLGDVPEYRARLEPWWNPATWVKLSSEDFAFLYPAESESDFAASLLERGVSVVTVTDGGKGARLYRRDHHALEITAPRVAVVDTVGAGDTFSGATIAKILELNLETPTALEAASDEALLEVLRFAVTAAAINCTRAGCDPPTRAEMASSGFITG
jgi:fructokinase